MNKQIITIKDALRSCGHTQDYTCTNKYRAEEFAKSSKCSKCLQVEADIRKQKEDIRIAIAKKWADSYGIKEEMDIDASETYSGSFPVTFWIKG